MLRPPARLLLAALACALSLPAAARQEQAPSGPPLAIDGEAVPRAEFLAWLVRTRGGAAAGDFAVATALERAARDHGVIVTDQDVRERVREDDAERIRETFGGDREAWLAELRRLGSDAERHVDDALERRRQELLVERLARALREPDEAALRAAWVREYGPGGRRPELSVLHLDVDPPIPPPDATREEVEALRRAAREAVHARALELRAQAQAGTPFRQLVERHSDDAATRARGGRIEGLDERVRWTRTVRDAVAALEEGQVSEPLLARGGWNLFRADEVTVTPYEDVRDELLARLSARPASASEVAAVVERFAGAPEVRVLPELSAPPSEGAQRLDAPVLEVDGRPVTRRELGEWIVGREGPTLARSFAERRLVEQLAAAEGIEVTPAEIEARLDEDAQRMVDVFHRGDRERWLADLTARGTTYEEWRRDAAPRARHDLLAGELLAAERTVTDARVRREWEHRHGPGGESPRVRFLMKEVPPPDEPLEDRAAIERYVAEQKARLTEELLELRRRIVEDGEDFAALARRHSDDESTRDRGGEPAERFRLHTWPQHVQEALRDLEPGELSQPVEVAGGLVFLFQLVEVVETPFEEVEAALRAELEAERPSLVDTAAFVNELFGASHSVEVLPGMYRR